jgi:RNA polymerase sigma factor (sigma-70 family)
MPTVICIETGEHRGRVLQARDELIKKHTYLVPPIARRIHKSLPPSFDIDDLIGEGNLGLLRAAIRYKPRAHGGTPFSAYARRVISGAIRDSYRRRHWTNATMAPIGINTAEDAQGHKGRGGFNQISPRTGRRELFPHEPPDTAQLAPDAIDQRIALERLQHAVQLLTPAQQGILATWYADGKPTRKSVAWRRRLAVIATHAQTLENLKVEFRRAA